MLLCTHGIENPLYEGIQQSPISSCSDIKGEGVKIKMEEYVSLKTYSEFAKGVINYMKRHSNDKFVINDIKDRLLKAETEMSALKGQLNKNLNERKIETVVKESPKLDARINKIEKNIETLEDEIFETNQIAESD